MQYETLLALARSQETSSDPSRDGPVGYGPVVGTLASLRIRGLGTLNPKHSRRKGPGSRAGSWHCLGFA